MLIKISDINLPTMTMRTDDVYESGSFKDLLSSIKHIGLCTPVNIGVCKEYGMPYEEKYFLLGGLLRLKCCQLLGYTEIECKIITKHESEELLYSALF